jgi:hypothetical protein
MSQQIEDALRFHMKKYHQQLMHSLGIRDFPHANQNLGALNATVAIYEEMTKTRKPRQVDYAEDKPRNP